MNKTILTYLQITLKSMLIIALILVSHQNAFANDDDYLPATESSETCTSVITFENKGCATVEVYFNYYGNYYHYKTLHPGKQYQQQTYEHDLWEVYTLVDGDYVYITSYTAGCEDAHVNINSGGGNIHVDAGNDQTICKGESIKICATGADHYEWNNGHTGKCITVSPGSDQTYSVTGTTNGCTDTDHVSVHVNKAKWEHVNKGNDTGCGDTCDGSIIVDANYNATGEFRVQYTYNGNTVTEGPFTKSGDITIDHLCAGTYSNITIIGVHTGCKDVWSDDITIQGGGSIHVDAGDDKTICQGESVQLCATGADHYEWSNGHTGKCISVSPNSDKTYTVTGTSNGCTDTDHVEVSIGNIHVDAGDDKTICQGESIQLCATGADHYEWSNGHTGKCITVSPNSDKTYTVTGTSNGCTDTDHVDVSIGNIHVDAGDDKTICEGESVQLCATGADHYEWSNGHTGKCISVSPNNDKTYTVTGTSNGCTDTDHVDVSIGNIHVDAGDDKTICRGESIELCATGADHYEWSNGHTGKCISVSPGSDRDYSVTGTTNGCTDTDHVSVHVDRAKWEHVNKGNDTGCGDTCDGSIIVDASYNVTGEFRVQYTYDGNTVTEGPFTESGDITLDHLCAGTYSNITIIGVHTGCKDVWSDNITIQGGGNIHVDAGDDKTICRGESIELCATGADHYEWSNGHTGKCISVSPNNDKTYTVTGTSNGCTDTDHVSVHVNKARWEHVNKGNDTGCGDTCDGSIIVDANYNATGEFRVQYTYDGNTVTEGPFTESGDITLDHLCAGTYSDITIIGVHTGCKDVWSDNITIQGGGNIHVDAGDDKTICRGESIELCATGADHYEWSNGHTGKCITVSPNSDRNYSVTGTTNGCTDTDHVSVHVNRAKWNNIVKNKDAGCGGCDGSISVDVDYDITGKFTVEYNYNGQHVTEGPYTDSSITLNHVCAGTYSDITIIGVHTGCKDVWSHDIIIENDCTQACEDYTLDFRDNGVNWHTNNTWDTYNLDGQEVDVDVVDNDHILKLTKEKNAGLEIGIDPHDTHDEVVITYILSEVSSHVLFDIVDLDYKNAGSKQQEAVCVYGLLGNDAAHILPTITSIDGSVHIDGNCAEATTNSSAGHDESILVEFTDCIDQIVIVYGTGNNSPTNNPTYSSIIIGKNLGFTSEVCPEPCESGSSSREDSFVADINIFPNPATHSLTLSIETDITGPADIAIIDGLGRVVNLSSIQLANIAHNYQVDVSALSAGVYFVKVFTQKGQSKAERLVILNR